MATNPSSPIKPQNIKTRKQLIETERSTRKLAQQKRNERKDAFLSAQKQLLKTTEYIEQLDELSHQLTSNIQETYQLLTNVNIPIHTMTHHFSQNINEFTAKHVNNNEMNKAVIASRHTHPHDTYDIEALIESFDDINTGHRDYNEAYLMNNIDAPFLSTFNDMSLFRDKIQSCLHSSCIYIGNKQTQNATEISDSKYEDIAFDTNDDYKQNEDYIDAYGSYLSAREILIQQLLRFMLVYPSQTKQNESITQYYEEILPFCLYSLIIILYQSSMYMEIDTEDDDDLYRLFDAFMTRSKPEIEQNVVQSLQMVKDNPSLLIACLNKYSAFVSASHTPPPPTKRSNDLYRSVPTNIVPMDIGWNGMFRKLATSYASDKSKCIDFMSAYLFHSSFHQCFDTLSHIVCDSLSSNFKMLFAKLSTNKQTEQKEEDKTEEIERNKSFGDIMNSIQENLAAILTLDHHETLLQSQLLSAYVDENITPLIQTSTKTTISRFISALESHLNRTNDSYTHSETHTSFSLDEEYLEIGVCCEKLETFIMSVIDEYTDKRNQDRATPISASLMQMVSSISSLKLRALKYWSSAMSRKLFADVSLHLENKLSFWNIYEAYYTKTVWKSIDDMDELTINIPCQPSEYIHDICFQFIQILLMIITQPHVPNSIIRALESEFRFSISQQLNQIFKAFLSSHNSADSNDISESFGLQLYFDVSFARAILTTVDALALWDDVLSIVSDEYIELVTMEYASKYLEHEIQSSVNNCVLIYGVHSSSVAKYINEEKEHKEDNTAEVASKDIKSSGHRGVTGGGNLFAKPIKKMKRIALLPVASYQISQSALNNTNESSLNKSPIRMGLLNHSTLLDDVNALSHDNNQKDKIAESFNQFTSGAMSHANTLFKNFGSMFQ